MISSIPSSCGELDAYIVISVGYRDWLANVNSRSLGGTEPGLGACRRAETGSKPQKALQAGWSMWNYVGIARPGALPLRNISQCICPYPTELEHANVKR